MNIYECKCGIYEQQKGILIMPSANNNPSILSPWKPKANQVDLDF